jgi:hypothetical protein
MLPIVVCVNLLSMAQALGVDPHFPTRTKFF